VLSPGGGGPRYRDQSCSKFYERSKSGVTLEGGRRDQSCREFHGRPRSGVIQVGAGGVRDPETKSVGNFMKQRFATQTWLRGREVPENREKTKNTQICKDRKELRKYTSKPRKNILTENNSQI